MIYSFVAEGDGDRGSGYTLFAPRDDAFWRVLVQVEKHFGKIFKRRKKHLGNQFLQDATAPDPFLRDSSFRLATLLGHLSPGRVFLEDLRPGRRIETMRGEGEGERRALVVKEVSGDGAVLTDGRQVRTGAGTAIHEGAVTTTANAIAAAATAIAATTTTAMAAAAATAIVVAATAIAAATNTTTAAERTGLHSRRNGCSSDSSNGLQRAKIMGAK